MTRTKEREIVSRYVTELGTMLSVHAMRGILLVLMGNLVVSYKRIKSYTNTGNVPIGASSIIEKGGILH